MNLDEILIFLQQRGKVVEADGVLRANIAEMCDHD